MTQLTRTARFAAGAGVAALLLAGCSAGPAAEAPESSATSSDAAADGTRVAVAYAGGVLIVDGETLEVVDDLPTEDFVRLNAAGDGRHAFVTTSEGFQLLDVHEPELTDLVVEAAAAGHVVRHGGKTVLYDDATSDTTIFDTDSLADVDGALPDAQVIEGVDAHHGVSVVLEDGTFVTTVGDATGRSGIRAVDADGAEIATSAECPGVHGEGTAKGEVVVFGCENGALVFDDGEITKLTSPDQYGRIGNAYVSENSPLVVMDYKDDPDMEGYLLTDIALVDTEANTLEKVELPDGISYTFRGVTRVDSGDAVLIGSDGKVHVIDPATGAITASHDAIDAWEGPSEWQQPHPAIAAFGDVVYVTDAANSTIVALDAATGEIITTAELPETPNEIAVVG
ncbi:zinc metallochaperone AztD [Microbacterium sp. AK031]|uniref:zinc metallochaperone AztD n=1 Tax=Microbacterium sp. AK031 TaxID=2723076 RepID=UPI002168F6EE|nr:zinc metallochaperone AztD [Microbacterium sp. AK031]MCS3843043.1 DNA-binding beta-propeller fold protein YncE [Microbacterium sp. AK031]